MSPNPFKVIVVGGGPVGLTAAHALHQAGIDFVILEARNEVAIDVGASLVLGPTSLRVFHQLGLLEDLLELGSQLNLKKSFTAGGQLFRVGNPFRYVRKNFGTAPMSFHRAHLIDAIYDKLPESAKANILTGKKVVDIESDEDGVKVICEDGSAHEGHLVLGADGVHSKTRRLMRKLALQENPNADWDEEVPFTSTYKCMWASFNRLSGSGEGFETQHTDRSIMYLSGKYRSWIFVYEKLPEPTKERVSYTQQDTVDFAARFADFPITEEFKVKDVFADRVTCGMANLEEGVLNKWSWGRIVLAGDACHKFTPNAGLGLQNGIQDVVVIANGLNKALSASAEHPTIKHLTSVFDTYKKQRTEKLTRDSKLSAAVTRTHAWADWFHYIMGRFVMSLEIGDYFFVNFLAARAERTQFVFDYIRKNEPFSGKVSWLHSTESGAVKN